MDAWKDRRSRSRSSEERAAREESKEEFHCLYARCDAIAAMRADAALHATTSWRRCKPPRNGHAARARPIHGDHDPHCATAVRFRSFVKAAKPASAPKRTSPKAKRRHPSS